MNLSTKPSSPFYNSFPIKTAHPSAGPFSPPLVVKIPNLKNTSEHVTNILIKINTMIIHVIRLILLSLMKSLSTSARSKKTRHRSFSTWMRGLISRYSRIAR
jgi:hypothetical protein